MLERACSRVQNSLGGGSLLRRGLFRLSGRLGNGERGNKARGSWEEARGRGLALLIGHREPPIFKDVRAKIVYPTDLLKKLTDNELFMSDNELFMSGTTKRKVKVRVQFECAWVKKDEKNQTFTQQIFFLFS